jgi:hypothetical protein
MEVIGVHTIQGLGMAADPVQKKLIPSVMPALAASGRIGRVAAAIDAALLRGRLVEPFSKTELFDPDRINLRGSIESLSQKLRARG